MCKQGRISRTRGGEGPAAPRKPAISGDHSAARVPAAAGADRTVRGAARLRPFLLRSLDVIKSQCCACLMPICFIFRSI